MSAHDDSAEGSISYRGTVYPWHCDHMGHMNIMWYGGKFDEANWTFFAWLGVTPGYLRGEQRGMAAVEQHITYRAELMAGDVVEVRSWLLEMRDKVVRLIHEMVNAETGEVAARSELTAVHLDRTARRAVAFPASVQARGRAMLGQAQREADAPR